MKYDLEEVLRALDQMAEDGIVENYAIGGAIAASFYGEIATTEDVDVFVVFKPGASSIIIDPTPVIQYFVDKGHDLFEDKVVIGGWPVQFLPPPGPLEEDAVENAIEMEADGLEIRMFSMEYVAAIALATGRSKDRNRLIQLREEGKLDMVEFKRIVDAHGLTRKWENFQALFPLE